MESLLTPLAESNLHKMSFDFQFTFESVIEDVLNFGEKNFQNWNNLKILTIRYMLATNKKELEERLAKSFIKIPNVEEVKSH